jgi:hypothetical protein
MAKADSCRKHTRTGTMLAWLQAAAAGIGFLAKQSSSGLRS